MTDRGQPLAPVIAVVGPSGVGKDSVIDAVCAARPGYQRVQRVITRQSEAGGEAFVKVTEAAFADMACRGAFALSWPAHGLQYGIPRDIEARRHGVDGLLVNLSRSVLLQAQAQFDDLIVIALSAARDVLADRLRARGRETSADQLDRLDRSGLGLPAGLRRLHHIENNGPLADSVQAVLDALEPERV